MSELPPLINLKGQSHFRIIPSCYPPINFFEDLVDPSEMDILWEIESITNERLRQETGDIFLVSPEDRIGGPGSSVVMAAFTHITPDKPTRFSDGTYGVYYAALSEETAIRETVYHRETFLRSTQEKACELTMRLYKGHMNKPFYDIRHNKYNSLHHPHDYSSSQPFGKKLKQEKAWGILYRSVRHAGGHCISALRPKAISIPKPIRHFKYVWNGNKITEILSLHPALTL